MSDEKHAPIPIRHGLSLTRSQRNAVLRMAAEAIGYDDGWATTPALYNIMVELADHRRTSGAGSFFRLAKAPRKMWLTCLHALSEMCMTQFLDAFGKRKKLYRARLDDIHTVR